MIPEICVAIAVVEYDGRFLVGRRDSHLPMGGFHEFPGGKVRPGESPPVAAQRECWEETGLRVEVGALLDEQRFRLEPGTPRECELHLHFYGAKVPMAPTLVPKGNFKWLTRSELSGCSFPPANQTLLRMLCAGQHEEKSPTK